MAGATKRQTCQNVCMMAMIVVSLERSKCQMPTNFAMIAHATKETLWPKGASQVITNNTNISCWLNYPKHQPVFHLPGLCEVCEFPFRSDRHYEREAEDCTPMVYDTVDDRTRYICSPAVYEINHVMIGIPYLWLCPKKEPHETQSTCFITNPSKSFTVVVDM